MNQMVINGAAPFLPEHIITNILKLLPVKSLIRFQCACKHWKNLFEAPSFIADHLRHSSHQNSSVLFFQTYGNNPLQLRLLDREMETRDVQKAPPFDSLCPELFSVIGSSNGLLCVTIRERQFDASPSSLLLWNPATRDVREVPRSKAIDSCVVNCVLGFGFSSIVNDYKTVAINGMACFGAEVYSLSRDSWKEIELVNILEDVVIFGETVVSSNGAIFWNGVKPGEKGQEGTIVSFDIANEVFALIPWPPLQGSSSFNLTVYNDKLAVVVGGIGGSPNIDLWVMEEDIGPSGERWSWTKKFSGGPFPWTLDVGAIIWKNEIVMAGTETYGKIRKKNPKSGLCLFNLTTNEFRMHVVPKHGFCHFLNYVESLVPVVN